MKKRILITLATGKTGFATASLLLSEGYRVRILVRSLNTRARALQEQGAEVVLGHFNDDAALFKALDEVDSVYYCYPYQPGMPEDLKLFIQAARICAVRSVVFMGQRIAEFADTGSRLTNDVRACYQLLEASGLNVVYFAPGYFADNVFVITEFVLRLGLFPNMFGKGKNPWISTADMARCLVALLKHPEPYYGKKLFPTGPASIGADEMAAIFSKVKGRKVRKVDIPEWLFFKSGMLIGQEYGFDTFAIVQGSYYNRQMRMNRFDIPPNGVVKELTGQEPEDFETIAKAHFSSSRYRATGILNWLKTFWKFNRIPFVSTPSRSERLALNNRRYSPH